MTENVLDVVVDPPGRDATMSIAADLHDGRTVRRPVDEYGSGPSDHGQRARCPGPPEAADTNLHVHALTSGVSKPENFTVRMDEELKRRMKDHPEINWSHVIREHVRSVLDDVERMDRLASGSDLTEEDVEALSAVIDAAAAERLRDDLASSDQGGKARDGGTEGGESKQTHDVTDAT